MLNYQRVTVDLTNNNGWVCVYIYSGYIVGISNHQYDLWFMVIHAMMGILKMDI